MEIQIRKLSDIIPYKNNPRKNDDAVDKVAESIRQCGYCAPIIVDENGVILAGHTRLKSLKKLGWTEAEVVVRAGLTDEQKKKYRLLDNKTGEAATWDFELLNLELEEIDFGGFDFGFEIEPPEVTDDDFDADAVADAIAEPVTKLGDIWTLGRHRLMCGDSTDRATVDRLMDGQKADLGFCDPPYNLGFEYNEYDDNKTDEEYAEFSKKWYQLLKGAADRKIVTLGTKNIGVMARLDEIAGVACWVKKNWITSCRIAKLQQWEPIFCYGDFTAYKRTSDLFEINRAYQKDVGDEHTCPKQIKLITEIIENYSHDKEKVIDLFGGSGTTLIVCEQLNRTCYMMELDPKYCDVIIKRWESLTGQKAALLNG